MRSIPLVLASLVVACSLGLGLRPATASAATPCWKSVIADWSDNGSIDRRYAPTCYQQAMLNAPTDLKIYSTLDDDLQSALRLRSSRRLAGASETPALTLNTSHDSSSLAFLVALIGGLGAFLAACSIAAALVRRRAAG